jgi:hypothetical protein
MSLRTRTRPDDAAADLVARTLRAVAEATPVAPADPPADGRTYTAPVLALARPLARRTEHRRLIAAAAAVALVAAAVTVLPRVVWGGSAGGGEAALPGAGGLPWELVATWLPTDLPTGGQALEPSGSRELRLRAQLFGQTDLGDDSESPWRPQAMVATVALADGTAVSEGMLATVTERLAPLFGADAGSPVVLPGSGAGAVVLTRPGAPGGLGQQLVERVRAASGVAVDPGVGGTTAAVPLDWVPDLAPTVGRRYANAGGDQAVELTTTEATLPDIGSLARLTGGDSLAIGAIDAWSWSVPGSGERIIAWQAAPGVVGQVRATGLGKGELERVVSSATLVGDAAPSGGPASQVVLRSDGPVSYQVQWAPGIEPGAGPCVVAVIEGMVVGPECGDESQPLPVFRSYGLVARTEDTAVVFGVFGPNVAYLTPDDPAIAEVSTVPLHPDAPATSYRVAVLLLPLGGDPTVGVTLRHADGSPVEDRDVTGYPLGYRTIDVEGPIGG